MVAEQILVGDRIDCGGDKGTVKYVGEVLNTEGIWLGIDWDDPERGKHDGTYNGTRYFQASYPTSGSFVRPKKVNSGYPLLEGIETKYGLESGPLAGVDMECMLQIQREIRAKLFEVVGAEKLNKLQSDFYNLRVVLLRDLLVNGAGPPLTLLRCCPNIEELDLSKTLISSWKEVAVIISQLKNLRILNLSENRLEIPEIKEDHDPPPSLNRVVLGKVTYDWTQVQKCSEYFLNVQFLQLHYNQISVLELPKPNIFSQLKSLDLEGNPIKSWDEINKLGGLITLESLNLNNCRIKEIHFPASEVSDRLTCLFKNLKTLTLSENFIDDWNSISELDRLQSLEDLKFRENPVLIKESSATNRQLIIAKIQNLEILNGMVIAPEDRKGAEIDYLKRFGLDWLKVKSLEERISFNKLHPSYQKIVEKYGPPEEGELLKPPTSLKGRLIQVEIFSSDKSISKKVPCNMSVEKLSGLIQRLFNTGSTMPRLSCIHAQRKDGLEVPLDDHLKDLSYYSVENGDKISVRW